MKQVTIKMKNVSKSSASNVSKTTIGFEKSVTGAGKLKHKFLLGMITTVFVSGSALAIGTAQLVDIDGDGVVSAEEIAQGRADQKAAMLGQYDTDGDGELSRSERKVMKADRRAALILEFDADGDGELSREERQASREARRANIEAQLDVNQDGVLSDAEQAGYNELRSERKGKRGRGHHGAHQRGNKHGHGEERAVNEQGNETN